MLSWWEPGGNTAVHCWWQSGRTGVCMWGGGGGGGVTPDIQGPRIRKTSRDYRGGGGGVVSFPDPSP